MPSGRNQKRGRFLNFLKNRSLNSALLASRHKRIDSSAGTRPQKLVACRQPGGRTEDRRHRVYRGNLPTLEYQSQRISPGHTSQARRVAELTPTAWKAAQAKKS